MEAVSQGEGSAMSLQAIIEERLQRRPLLLMTHVIVGYPSIEVNWTMLEIMAEHDVDVVELQLPFSEPMADGPTFVAANEGALKNGMNVQKYFDFLERSTQAFGFPQLCMGYYNPVFRMGHTGFCERLKAAGAKGFIVPDLPVEEAGDLPAVADSAGLAPIQLMTPTNTSERLAKIAELARGFVYAVARKGVTGAKTDLAGDDLDPFLRRCRAVTDLPLALGFGLSNGDDLRQLHGKVEMGIVGSALLKTWESGGEPAFRELIASLAAARGKR
jgi:tryptophan synthase alpha chain